MYIEITAGSPEAARLKPGTLIPSDDVTGFAQMSGAASSAMDELTELLRGMNDLLNEHNKQRISEMITSLNQISRVTEENLQETLENMNSLIAEVNSMTIAAKDVIVKNDTSVSRSVQYLETLLSHSVATVNSLDIVLSEVDRSLFENQQQYNQIMENLNSLKHQANQLSARGKQLYEKLQIEEGIDNV